MTGELAKAAEKRTLEVATVTALAKAFSHVDFMAGAEQRCGGPPKPPLPETATVQHPVESHFIALRFLSLAGGKAVVKHPRRTGCPLLRKLPFTSFTSANEFRTGEGEGYLMLRYQTQPAEEAPRAFRLVPSGFAR